MKIGGLSQSLRRWQGELKLRRSPLIFTRGITVYEILATKFSSSDSTPQARLKGQITVSILWKGIQYQIEFLDKTGGLTRRISQLIIENNILFSNVSNGLWEEKGERHHNLSVTVFMTSELIRVGKTRMSRWWLLYTSVM